MSQSKKMLLLASFVTGLATAVTTYPSSAASNLKTGVLTCVVEGGVGFIIGSSKEMTCEFESVSGRKDFYTGKVKKFGIDIGVTGKSYLKWVVLAPTGRPKRGGLAGTYVGVSGEATVGAGLGASGLVGGSDKSFSLQPFSAQAQTGLNIALGVGSMTLRAVD